MNSRWQERTAAILLALFLLQLTQCSHSVEIAPSRLHPNEAFNEVRKIDGTVVVLDDGNTFIVHDTVVANVHGAPYRVPLDSVQSLWVTRSSAGRTLGLTLGIIVGLGLLLAIPLGT